MNKKDILFLLLFLGVVLFFYRPVLLEGKVPVPTDTLVNLYHPLRDYFASEYPRGVPYKNSLINDPITQQIPWRTLSVDQLKEGTLPLWNSYSMAGYPLLGSIQAAPLYPFNILLLFVFLPGWTVFIMLQQILIGIFMYLYLRNLKLLPQASFLGSLSFAFSGFVISWLEWGTVIHTALWLPLLLLAIDKILKGKKQYLWTAVAVLAIVNSFLAGHLQTWTYLVGFGFLYSLARVYTTHIYVKNGLKVAIPFISSALLLIPLFVIQLKMIFLSARNVDLSWEVEGWFIPVHQLVQFIAPDFFGNPATGNYWGIWNYGEFIGYIGIIPLLFALTAMLLRRDKKTLFFAGVAGTALLFAVELLPAKIPFLLEIPLFSTTQPTRLLFIVDFAVCVLAALGIDYALRTRKISYISSIIVFSLLGMSFFVLHFLFTKGNIELVDYAVSKKNLIVPMGLLVLSSMILIFQKITKFKLNLAVLFLLFIITIVDLLFFAQKFTPFSDPAFYYPVTKSISFLKEQKGQFRIMATDRRIMHPNIPVFYKIQTVDGYDPLYLQRYGELISASQREKPDISSPFGFNRIIVPSNYDSKIIDLMGVRYIFSLTDLQETQTLQKVFEEGETKIYENKKAFPRAFFVTKVVNASTKQDAVAFLLKEDTDLKQSAVVENADINFAEKTYTTGKVTITSYKDNKIVLQTESTDEGFLVFTDSFYDSWHATIDEVPTEIYLTDFHFRGIEVPSGRHEIQFVNSIF